MESLSIGVLIAQLINFGILFFFFKKFLGDKLIAEIESRKNTLESVETMEKDSQKALEEAQKQAEKIISDAKNEGREIISTAEDLAKTKGDNILAKAEEDAEKARAEGLRNLEAERQGMLGEMKTKMVDVAMKLNAKLFEKEDSNKEFIEKQAKEITL